MSGSADIPISPVGVSKPELVLTAAAINNEPVELDSKPTSPEHVRRGSRGGALEDLSLEEQQVRHCTAQTEATGSLTWPNKKRAQLISERKDNPAVLVDIPTTPDADEFEQSGAAVVAGDDQKAS
jgi:3',5'-cyclic AMP phosphodiesterase CpdA